MKIEIWVADDQIIIKQPFTEGLREIAKSIPGAKWSKPEQVWYVPLSPHSSTAVLGTYGAATLDTHSHTFEIDIDPRIDEEARSLNLEIQDKPIPKTNQDVEPWPVQREAFWAAMDQFTANTRGAGILLDMAMGRGKSRVAIDIAQNITPARPDGVCNILVLCPKSVLSVWPIQLLTHAVRPQDWNLAVLGARMNLGFDYPRHWIFEHRSKLALRAEIAKDIGNRNDRPFNMIVVNFEGSWQGELGPTLKKLNLDLLVADEVHRLKSASSRQSRWAFAVANKTKRRVGLSGTMMPHSPLDAFGVGRFADHTVFGLSVTVYKAMFLYRHPTVHQAIAINPHTGDWFRSKEVRKEFEARWGRISYRAEKDWEGLPPLIIEDRYADLSPSAATSYNDLRKDMVIEIEAKLASASSEAEFIKSIVTSPTAMHSTMRLQQLCCGFLMDEENRTIEVDDSKKKLLKDILEDVPADKEVVIFCRYHHDLQTVQDVAAELKRPWGEVSGRVKERAVTGKWVKENKVSILGVQSQSGSLGVDYNLAKISIFFSVWGLGDFKQSRDRNHRPGQDEPVTHINLLTNPIRGHMAADARIIKAMRGNDEVLESIARQAWASRGASA